MPHISDTERRAQRKRDYAVQVAMLQKQAWDGCCEPVNIRLEECDGECVVRFRLFHRDDDNTGHRVRATGATFREAFKAAYAKLPGAIKEVTEDAAFRADCADEPSPEQRRADMLAAHAEDRADDAWLEARAAS